MRLQQLLGLLLGLFITLGSVTALTDDRFSIARTGWHNPSVAVQSATNRTFTTFRQTWIKNIDGKQWWFNKAFLCEGNQGIQKLKCKQYNPFKTRVPEVSKPAAAFGKHICMRMGCVGSVPEER
jgi:hypothetical protein